MGRGYLFQDAFFGAFLELNPEFGNCLQHFASELNDLTSSKSLEFLKKDFDDFKKFGAFEKEFRDWAERTKGADIQNLIKSAWYDKVGIDPGKFLSKWVGFSLKSFPGDAAKVQFLKRTF